MSAAVVLNPVSGSIINQTTAIDVTVTGASSNDATAYDATKVPSEPQLTYYLTIEKSGQPTLRSPVFAPSADGKAEWHDVIVPSSGTWTAYLRKVSDDSSAASTTCVVS